jgi:hypothetical protein
MVHAVRSSFGPIFRTYGFQEVGQHDDLNFASVTARSANLYLRISSDFRDRAVTAYVGRVSEGVVPPIPIAPAQSAESVREIPHPIVVWLATGDKSGAFATGRYEEEKPEEVAAAVRRIADALMAYGRDLLAGDELEWRRAADLTVSRHWVS